MNYEQWKEEVDRLFRSYLSLSAEDVEDYDWYSLYEMKVTPVDAFNEWKSDMVHF